MRIQCNPTLVKQRLHDREKNIYRSRLRENKHYYNNGIQCRKIADIIKKRRKKRETDTVVK